MCKRGLIVKISPLFNLDLEDIMITVYTQKGKAVSCELTQLADVKNSGFTLTKPNIKVGVSSNSKVSSEKKEVITTNSPTKTQKTSKVSK